MENNIEIVDYKVVNKKFIIISGRGYDDNKEEWFDFQTTRVIKEKVTPIMEELLDSLAEEGLTQAFFGTLKSLGGYNLQDADENGEFSSAKKEERINSYSSSK